MKRILLVEPAYPTPKSRNHHIRIPIGLLKIGSYLQSQGDKVMFIRMVDFDFTEVLEFNPDRVMITSLYSYWSEYVTDAVNELRLLIPSAEIEVGGVFASLEPELCKEVTGADTVYIGCYEEAEKFLPDYSLLNEELDFQIIHTSRGCNRSCGFCGVNTIEPEFTYKKSIKDEVFKRNIVFYDNNLLANPYIEDILHELIELKQSRAILHCESQSGFDGRILKEKPHIAVMMKQAGFIQPKIAWDNGIESKESFIEQVQILKEAGFRTDKMGVFMLYNHNLPYTELEKKRVICYEQKIQIIDCRYRPYTQTYDHYKPRSRNQTNQDYYIHPNWTDGQIKRFRKNVRRTNQCVRYRLPFYSSKFENGKVDKTLYLDMSYDEVKEYLDDAWNPSVEHILAGEDNQGVLQ